MKFKNRSKRSKMFITLGFLSLLMLGSLGAYYLFEYGSISSYVIRGEEGSLNVLIELSDVNWNVTDSLEHSQNLVVENNDGLTQMEVNFEVLVNVMDENCSGQGDIDYQLYLYDIEINDGDYINLSSGTNILSLNASTENVRICPRNDLVTLNLTEVGL